MKLTRPKANKDKGKPKGKPKGKAAPKAKTTLKVTGKGKYKGKSVHVERSIKSVLARTGFPKESGKPGSKSFKYAKDSDIVKKEAEAWAWLKRIGA